MLQRSIVTISAAFLLMPGIVHTAEGDAARGTKLFKQCALCHVIEHGRKLGIGLNLAGVIVREVGST